MCARVCAFSSSPEYHFAKEQAAAILAQHEAQSAQQQAAAEAKVSEAEAIARETIVKHQVDKQSP